jgi:hypothetical protein
MNTKHIILITLLLSILFPIQVYSQINSDEFEETVIKFPDELDKKAKELENIIVYLRDKSIVLKTESEVLKVMNIMSSIEQVVSQYKLLVYLTRLGQSKYISKYLFLDYNFNFVRNIAEEKQKDISNLYLQINGISASINSNTVLRSVKDAKQNMRVSQELIDVYIGMLKIITK